MKPANKLRKTNCIVRLMRSRRLTTVYFESSAVIYNSMNKHFSLIAFDHNMKKADLLN